MGKAYHAIDDELGAWIAAQKLFFVATAPRSDTGLVNCSPKGGDALRVLGPLEVAYLDGSGSGVETIAHLRENARIVVMFCAFEGSPRIVRLHGSGEVIDGAHPEFGALLERFPKSASARTVIRIAVSRVSDSCGYGVPLYEYRAERSESANYVAKASDHTLRKYLLDHNQQSLEGLPGLSPEAIDGVRFSRS